MSSIQIEFSIHTIYSKCPRNQKSQCREGPQSTQAAPCFANAFLLPCSTTSPPPLPWLHVIKHLCIVNPSHAISILKLLRKNCAGTHLEHSHCSPASLWSLLKVWTIQSKQETGSGLGWGKEGSTISNKSAPCSLENRVGSGKWINRRSKIQLQLHHSILQLNKETSVAQRSFSLSYQPGLTLSRQLKHEKFPFL